MNQTTNTEKLEKALNRLEDDDIEALVDMIDESPELLRQTLSEYGYLNDDDEEDDRFLSNSESSSLTEAQIELAAHLHGQLGSPRTVGDILEIVGSEESEFRRKYSSAQYRSWVSNQLNALVKAGEIGRYRESREIKYTETPVLAVRNWARVTGRFPDNLTVGDAVEIKNDTEMPGRVVKDAIRSLIND